MRNFMQAAAIIVGLAVLGRLYVASQKSSHAEARRRPKHPADHEFTDWNTLANFVDGFLETTV